MADRDGRHHVKDIPPMADKAPMCPGSLLLGNAKSLLDDTAGTLTRGYQLLGPMFRIRAAWRQYTVIAGPEAGEFMAQGLDKVHLSRERLFGSIAREFGPCDLVLKEIGPKHARLRPPLAVAYSRQVASPHVPAMVDAVRQHARNWAPGSPLEVVNQVKQLAFAEYGVLLGMPRITFRDSLLMTDYLMNVAARLLPSLVFRAPWYRRAHRRTYGALTELVRQRRADGPGDGPPTLIDALASACDPTGTPLTEDEVVSYAAYGLGASIGYVGRLASFMLYEILRDADLHAQLVAEAQAAFVSGLDDASDVRRMRLLRSVYDETLRFHPFAIGMAFDVASDFQYLGHRVNQGSFLVLSPVPSSADPTSFPGPHRFDPARCREPRNEHRRSQACQPFGLGDRTCAAMGLVELMTMTLVATVLHTCAVAMHPRDYTLRRTTRPLPSPDRHFKMTAAAPAGAHPAAAHAIEASEEDALAAFPGHDQPAVRAALAGAVRQVFAPGAVIVREGDAADAFYLIEQGSVAVTRAAQGDTRALAVLGEGAWFGEAGLLQQAPRNATVTAGAKGAVARVLGQQAFLTMVATSDLVAAEIGQLLQKRVACARLQQAAPQLTAEGGARLLSEFRARTYRAGEAIVRQGEPAGEFFILVAGEAVVTRRDASGRDQDVARLDPGDYFGEIGLVHGTPRNATVAAAGAHDVETLVTDRAGFDRLLAEGGRASGALAQAMRARAERFES